MEIKPGLMDVGATCSTLANPLRLTSDPANLSPNPYRQLNQKEA